jgi:peptide chain release factor 1
MEAMMKTKLDGLVDEFDRLSHQMMSQEVASDPALYSSCARARRPLEDVVRVYREYREVAQQLAEAEELIRSESDPEMRELAEQERDALRGKPEELEQELRLLLVPRDPNDEKNVIVEIRAGAGGDEAAIFCADLFRMFSRYADLRGWRVETLSKTESDHDGYRSISFRVEGDEAYSQLKYEAGVHRVQRVPATESQGRIHTSTATVAVLPEAEEVELDIDEGELKFDVYRSSGPGGQSVNTTDSAIRVTHLPTGMVVTCQDEKSQHKNKAKALMVLRARLLDLKQQEEAAKTGAERRSQIGSGDRSEKIRTYNYPQSRITDHRIGKSIHNLDAFMNGEIQDMVDALTSADRAEKLAAVE